MYEHKSVGPNLKTYYYYTNEIAEQKNSDKEVFVLATGHEGTGALYDEVAQYFTDRGHAFYALDEWQYGKTGKVNKKKTYKNWGKKDSYYAAYNVHALTVLVKKEHPNAKICLIGNDFGAMLSLYLIKAFPEVVDRIVTLGWGKARGQDYGLLVTSYIRKFFFYDKSESKTGHFAKNKTYYLRFESNNKYSWLSSQQDQVKKIVDAGYINTAGTVGHYFYYYLRKILVPHLFMNFKNTDKNTPMLFISGDEDLTTHKGKTTQALAKCYERRGFSNVNSLIVPGRHQVLFDKARFEVLDSILEWCESGAVEIKDEVIETPTETYAQPVVVENTPVVEEANIITLVEPEVTEAPVARFDALLEAEDDLLIKTNR